MRDGAAVREPAAPAAGDRGLLDTSVLIAREAGRPLDAAMLPAQAYISVITLAALGELQVFIV